MQSSANYAIGIVLHNRETTIVSVIKRAWRPRKKKGKSIVMSILITKQESIISPKAILSFLVLVTMLG